MIICAVAATIAISQWPGLESRFVSSSFTSAKELQAASDTLVWAEHSGSSRTNKGATLLVRDEFKVIESVGLGRAQQLTTFRTLISGRETNFTVGRKYLLLCATSRGNRVPIFGPRLFTDRVEYVSADANQAYVLWAIESSGWDQTDRVNEGVIRNVFEAILSARSAQSLAEAVWRSEPLFFAKPNSEFGWNCDSKWLNRDFSRSAQKQLANSDNPWKKWALASILVNAYGLEKFGPALLDSQIAITNTNEPSPFKNHIYSLLGLPPRSVGDSRPLVTQSEVMRGLRKVTRIANAVGPCPIWLIVHRRRQTFSC